MAELYIFSQDDKLLSIITEETGLISAPVREELNQVPDTPFSFTVEADSRNAKYVVEENQVVFRDKEGDLQLFVIKELDDLDNAQGPETTAICEPGFMELAENIIEDRRFVDQTVNVAMNAAVQGTRYTAVVEGEFGRATTNFYRLSSVDAIWKVRNNWGGDIKAVVKFDDENNITTRQIKLVHRFGTDKGHRFEIDHNATEIQRTALSYPKTAMYGWGASLETEGGGHTRYIDFGEVEWKQSSGHPVDKPIGQKWVGDPDALLRYGRKHNGLLLHRYGQFSNQDYEDPAELLWATWNNLQENKEPEINYRLSVDGLNQDISLGDSAVAIDREFSRPIEIQARIIAVEYDLLDIEGTLVVEMGQFLNLHDDTLDRVVDDVEKLKNRPAKISEGSYPDIAPGTPTNFKTEGGFDVVQLYWSYESSIYIKHYEVYGSQVEGFIPNEAHLLYRGDVSSFAHKAGRDSVWYYRVRAVNHHGTTSDFTPQVRAETVRIISDDILFNPDLAERLRGLSETSQILAEGSIPVELLDRSIIDGERFRSDLIALDGTSYIAEGVIGTAAIANLAVTSGKIDNLAVKTFHVEDSAITNAKIANLAVDDAKIANLSVVKLLAGTLDASKIKIFGGSAIDYTQIDGSVLESRGRYTRRWRGQTSTSDIKIRMLNGYLQVRNDSKNQSLYFSDFGISTYADANGEIGASGTIAFRDEQYSTAGGLTVHSYAGVVALKSEQNRIVVDAYGTANIESKTASVYFRPFMNNRPGTNEFRLWVKDHASYNDTDGVLSYGTSEINSSSGLRFKKNISGDSIVYVTNGAGDINTGKMQGISFLGDLEAQGDEAFVRVGTKLRVTDKRGYNGGNTNLMDFQAYHIQANSIRTNNAGAHLFAGVSSAELRVTDNFLDNQGNTNYRPVRAGEYYIGLTGRVMSSGGETYVQGNGGVRATRYMSGTLVPMTASAFNNTSLLELKQDIKEWKDSALAELNKSTFYEYRLKDEVLDGYDHVKYGFIIGKGYYVPRHILSRDGEGIDSYSHSVLNSKAIIEVDTKVLKIIEKQDDQNTKIQLLQNELILQKRTIEQQQRKIENLEEMIA